MKIEAQVKLLERNDGLKGVADLTFDKSFVVKGIFIREGDKGLFVSFPSSKIGNEYKPNCLPITAECREQVTGAILDAYQQKLSAVQNKEQNHGETEQSKSTKGKTQAKSSSPSQKASPAQGTQEAGESPGMSMGM